MSRRQRPWLFGVAVTFACVLFLGAIVATMVYMDRQDAKDVRAEDALFARANNVCGAAPLSIKTHGASWNWGPWIEVVCADGTRRAVR